MFTGVFRTRHVQLLANHRNQLESVIDSSMCFPLGLSPLQRLVLTRMLDCPGDEFARIRGQLADSGIRSHEFTGVGGYVNFSVPQDSAFYGSLQDRHLGTYAIHSKSGALGVFELSISDGCIDFLEYATTGGDAAWPDDESLFELLLEP